MNCFVAADRIVSLEQLLIMSQKQQGMVEMHEAPRNQILIFWLLAGTLHETGAALQELCSAQVVKKMKKKKTVWGPLNSLRGEWNTSPMGSMMRNQIGHHLGETKYYEAGLAAVTARRKRRVTLLKASGSAYHDGRYVLAADAVLLGLNIQKADMVRFMSREKKAHLAFPARLTEAFMEVLRTVGIGFVDARTT